MVPVLPLARFILDPAHPERGCPMGKTDRAFEGWSSGEWLRLENRRMGERELRRFEPTPPFSEPAGLYGPQSSGSGRAPLPLGQPAFDHKGAMKRTRAAGLVLNGSAGCCWRMVPLCRASTAPRAPSPRCGGSGMTTTNDTCVMRTKCGERPMDQLKENALQHCLSGGLEFRLRHLIPEVTRDGRFSRFSIKAWKPRTYRPM